MFESRDAFDLQSGLRFTLQGGLAQAEAVLVTEMLGQQSYLNIHTMNNAGW